LYAEFLYLSPLEGIIPQSAVSFNRLYPRMDIFNMKTGVSSVLGYLHKQKVPATPKFIEIYVWYA